MGVAVCTDTLTGPHAVRLYIQYKRHYPKYIKPVKLAKANNWFALNNPLYIQTKTHYSKVMYDEDEAPQVPKVSKAALREALKENAEEEKAEAAVQLDVATMTEESVGTYIVPIESTSVNGDAGEAAVINADVRIANGVLRAVAAGWNNVRTLKDVADLAKLTLDVIERRRKLLNHQHGPASTTKTLNLNDYVS